MNIADIKLDGFGDRKQSLHQIKRYHIYTPMFYRTTDYFHSVKVFNLVKNVSSQVVGFFGDQFDKNKAMIMALVHDDAEIITGDILSGQKVKMSDNVIRQIENNEIAAIDVLAKRYPKTINGYNYRDLLLEVMDKESLESQVVKYMDHVDALGEAYHELYAGNRAFITNVIDHDLGKIELPHEYYILRFNDYGNRYPLLKPLMSKEPPLLISYSYPNATEIVNNGKLHTNDSLRRVTGNTIYDWWKKVLLENLKPEELENLYIQKEL